MVLNKEHEHIWPWTSDVSLWVYRNRNEATGPRRNSSERRNPGCESELSSSHSVINPERHSAVIKPCGVQRSSENVLTSVRLFVHSTITQSAASVRPTTAEAGEWRLLLPPHVPSHAELTVCAGVCGGALYCSDRPWLHQHHPPPPPLLSENLVHRQNQNTDLIFFCLFESLETLLSADSRAVKLKGSCINHFYSSGAVEQH